MFFNTSKDENSLPYISEYVLPKRTPGEKTLLNAHAGLRQKTKFLYRETLYDNSDPNNPKMTLKRLAGLEYDVAVTLTP